MMKTRGEIIIKVAVEASPTIFLLSSATGEVQTTITTTTIMREEKTINNSDEEYIILIDFIFLIFSLINYFPALSALL